MSAVTIRTVADVPAAAAAVLGFMPSESLVILGTGGRGPTARVDLGEGAIESLAPAVRHWTEVLLVVFSDIPQARAYVDAFRDTYPSVRVLNALDVRDGQVTSLGTGKTVPVSAIAPGILGDRPIADSRDSLIAEADQITDPTEALRLAEAYYRSGDGARGWVYADRARDLGADTSVIEAQMWNVDDPRGAA